MKRVKHLSRKAISLLLMISMVIPLIAGLPVTATGMESGITIDGTLGTVSLITGNELEIEFSTPVLNEADAKATFKIFVDGVEAEWEYLSYFAFGPYAAKPIVNVRLKDTLDTGNPRGRMRNNTATAYYDRTEHVYGPIAAAKVTVKAAEAEKTANWTPFYMERHQGEMTFFWAYASRLAGTYPEAALTRADGVVTNWRDSDNVFSGEQKPRYTDEWVARMVGEGMNKFTGYSEYLNLPMIYAGFRAFLVGPSQSVYEVPEYRDLYKHGETTDTYTRQSIKATDVPGNFDPVTGEFARPFIVSTADDVMKHDSFVDKDGKENEWGASTAARPKIDHFYFGEAWFDIFYHLGVLQGSQGWPLSPFNNPDDFRFDLHLQEAYEKAKAANLWPGSKMMDSLKDYYIGGALIHYEMMRETQSFAGMTGPVNTRYELQEYDYPLFWALSGIHHQNWYWCGTGTGQAVNNNSDTWKVHTPWFWLNQADEYAPPAPGAAGGTAYPPLEIERVTVVDHNRIEVHFNREVSTLAALARAANWRIFINDREINSTNGLSVSHAYGWKSIHLRTNHTITWTTGASASNAANRLDNGVPYGEYFNGFTQKDIDERSVAAGGWIANNQAIGTNALEFGEFASIEDAIANGAGTNGKIEVAYVPQTTDSNKVKDWSGNELKDTKVQAGFMPRMGNAYRTPLTGFYFYFDSAVATQPYYKYRNEGPDFVQPTAKDIAMAAGHQYETQFTVNSTTTYPASAGGGDFVTAFTGNTSNQWNLSTPVNANLGITWIGDGVVTAGSQTLTNNPVTYDRPSQRIVDGAVRANGGGMISAASVFGHHVTTMNHRSFNGSIVENLRIEGWGGNKFDSIDTAVIRDFNLLCYRNENLIFHEGGHGIDSFSPTYAQNLYNDVSAARATAIAPLNGLRYRTVDGVVSYSGTRSEYVSTGTSFFGSVMREGFQGFNDGVWTPISNREELFRYDPYAFEALKRHTFNGDLSLWYEGKVGDPAYRVIPEDWILLKEQNPEFSHWTSVNDLVAWGLTIPRIAQRNPYTGTHNSLVNWPSYGNASVWDVDNYREPTRVGDWREYVKYDWKTVGKPYYEAEPGKPPTKSRINPFYTEEGVKVPVRTPEIAALVAPVSGKIVEGSLKMISKVLFEFELEDFTGALNMNNAAVSFDLRVNGQKTHFYFWTFEDIGNNVAKVQLRLEWPEENDPTLKLTVKETGQTAISDAVLRLNLSKGVVEKGEYFTLSPAFSRVVESNVAVLNFTYNKNLFDYRAFEPAAGVTVVSWELTEDGVQVIVMIPDYEMQDYGKFLFSAKEDVNLKLETQKIALTINFVERFGDIKWTKMAIVDTVFATSDGTDPTNPPDGEFTLITLSNAIDYFGVRKGQAGWDVALFFDYNASGDIDISDIAYIASKIVL